jgi:hypothetical protein
MGSRALPVHEADNLSAICELSRQYWILCISQPYKAPGPVMGIGLDLLYACVKEVRCLWAQPWFDTVHHYHYRWSAVIQSNSLGSKQVVIVGREIKAVRRAINKALVKSSSGTRVPATVYGLVRGGALHRMSAFLTYCSEWRYAVFLVFRSTLLMLMWPIIAYVYLSARVSFPKKQLPSAIWQADNVCLNFTICLANVYPLLWLPCGFNIHKWNPRFITSYAYDVLEKFIAIFVVSL